MLTDPQKYISYLCEILKAVLMAKFGSEYCVETEAIVACWRLY